MRNLYGVISCCVLLSLAVVLDNAHAKQPQKSAEVSAISLDVLRVKACAVGQGCSTVGGPKQWNLFDLAEGKTDFANQVLMPAKTHELRLMLGSKSTITVDGQTYSLTVPSGQVSGLKLKGNKVFASASGFLKSIRLNFDLAKGLVVQAKKVKGKDKKGGEAVNYSYSLKPVIQVSAAEITPLPENMTAIVALPEKETKLKNGNNFLLIIPVGAVVDPVVITSEETEESVYKLSPDNFLFNNPVSVNINYNLPVINELGYTENDLTMLRNGVIFPSLTDTDTKRVTAYTVRFSTYAVGAYNYTANDSVGYKAGDCIQEIYPSKLTEEELKEKVGKALEQVEENLADNFMKMYLEMDKKGKLSEGHEVCGYRTQKTAHRFSTGSAIYNDCVSLNDLKDWARTEDGADGKDVDENIWYIKTWESEIDKLCKSDIKVSGVTIGRLEDFFSDPPCRDLYMESYIKDQAKKNVSEIVNKGKWYKLWQSDTVTYALEGYDPYTKERKPNSDSMEISQHVQGKAVDLKIDWSRFEGGAWGSEVESLKDKYHLFRPYDQEKDGDCSPIKEHWHFELAPVEVKPPDDKSCPYGNGLYCGKSSLDQDENTLYYCKDGEYNKREQCSDGCEVMPPDVDDKCKSGQTSCPYGTGYYCGDDQLGQDKDTLYYCKDGHYDVHEQCSNGCEEKPPYVNDVCK